MIFSSRGGSVFSTDDACSMRLRWITASEGDTAVLSSRKSPRCESSSSPMGVSSEIGCCAIFLVLRTWSTLIHANRIIRLLDRSRCQIEFAVLGWKFLFRLYGTEIGTFRGITSGLGTGGIFVDIDAIALKGGKHFVNLVGGMHFWGENVVHLVVEQIAALLANPDELAYLVVLFLDRRCQGFLRCQAAV